MNGFFFDTKTLMAGQSSPYTGAYVDSSRCRNLLFNFYASGTVSGLNQIFLQFENPFFKNNEGITFYTITGLTSGYYTPPIFSDSPMPRIRAVSSGIGNFWVGYYGQS